MSIRTRLIVVLLAISIISIAAVSAISYLTVSRELQAQTNDNLQIGMARQKQRINAVLGNARDQTLQLSVKFDLKRAVQQYQLSRNQADLEIIRTLLLEKLNEEVNLLTLSVTDTKGNVIYSTDEQLTGRNLAGEPYFGDPDEQSVLLLPSSDRRSDGLYITDPISADAQTVGVLVVVYTDSGLSGIAQDYTGMGHSGETMLVSLKEGKPVSLLPLRFNGDAAFKTDLSAFGMSDAADQLLYDVVDYRGEHVLAATTYLDLVDWGLAVKIDRSEALGPIIQLRNIMVVVSATVIVTVVAAAFYFSRLLTKPILALTDKARRIAAGDFSQRADVTSNDEIGRLGRTFNVMLADIQKSRAQIEAYSKTLEERVYQRTVQLSAKVKEVEQAKAKDEAVLASVGDGMVVTDNNGRILLMNQMAADLLGLNRAAVISTPIDSWPIYDEVGQPVPTESRPAHIALATRKRTLQTLKSIKKDGAKVALSVTATPVIQEGIVIGVIQIIRDITKEKEVDRMKTEFISLASHQLRTPLSAIKWFSEMLLGGDAGDLTPDQKEFAQNITDSTERMIDLVNSLLNISRIESGRIIVDPKPTDLSKLVSGIITDLKAKTEQKHQTMVVSVHKDLPEINLDPRLIGQVYMNFLTNAIKYTPKGGEISVFVSRKDNDVVSQITDNGYGIPKAQQGKLFQKFFRAENVAKVETDGTGLGLYLVKAIIESSGGKVWFESEEGKGTTFWFSLPMSGMKPKAGEVSLD